MCLVRAMSASSLSSPRQLKRRLQPHNQIEFIPQQASTKPFVARHTDGHGIGMETLLSRSFNIRHLGPHTKLKVRPQRRATRPTLEKQSVSSFMPFNGIACIFINRKTKRRS